VGGGGGGGGGGGLGTPPTFLKERFHMVLVHLSARDPSCRDSRQHEGDYSGISHPCRPIPAVLNRKVKQEWHREEKENDVT
jgi:hypothetical protein